MGEKFDQDYMDRVVAAKDAHIKLLWERIKEFNDLKVEFTALQSENQRLRDLLTDVIHSVRGGGAISRSPERIYTPHIYVETVKQWEEVLSPKSEKEK
jgi:hypothetical protein